MTEEFRDVGAPPNDAGGILQATAAININSRIVEFEIAAPLDTAAPVIDNFSPAQGSDIEPQQSLMFDVTDESGLFSTIIVHAVFADGVEEVVHDGTNFRGFYTSTSSRVLITNGWRYTVLRSGGWPSSPVMIRVFAVDGGGNLTEA